MDYDFYIASMADDFYMADAICRELEKRGKKCFFNWRDSKHPEKLDAFTLAGTDKYIIIVNKTSLNWDYYKYSMNTRAQLVKDGEDEEKDIVFLNEDIDAFPTKWGTVHVFNAQNGLTIDMIATMLGTAPVATWQKRNAKDEEKAKKEVAASAASAQATQTQSTKSNVAASTVSPSVAVPQNKDVKIEFERVEASSPFSNSLDESMSNTVKRAVRYFTGEGVPQDYDRAFSLFNKAIEENAEDAQAYFGLGVCHETGLGTTKDLAKAKDLYKKAQEFGYTAATIQLASVLLFNEADVEGTRNLLKKIAKSGNLDAIYLLGVADETEDKLDDAVDHYSEAAELGNAKAQNALGCLYAEGKGVAKNMKNAMQWFDLAAQQSLAVAHFNLGLILTQEEGEMFEQGVQHFRDAANAGHAEAAKVVQEIDKRVEEAKQAELRRKRAAERRRKEEEEGSDFLGSFLNGLDPGGLADYAKGKLW